MSTCPFGLYGPNMIQKFKFLKRQFSFQLQTPAKLRNKFLGSNIQWHQVFYSHSENEGQGQSKKRSEQIKTKTQEYRRQTQQFHVWPLELGWNHVGSRGFESDPYPANPNLTLPLISPNLLLGRSFPRQMSRGRHLQLSTISVAHGLHTASQIRRSEPLTAILILPHISQPQQLSGALVQDSMTLSVSIFHAS